MKKSWRSIALAILALCPSASIASDAYPEFSKSIDQAVTKSKIDAKGLAMHITAADGRVILDKNSGRSLIPASLTKIVTAAALLEEFPIGHQFETELYGG